MLLLTALRPDSGGNLAQAVRIIEEHLLQVDVVTFASAGNPQLMPLAKYGSFYAGVQMPQCTPNTILKVISVSVFLLVLHHADELSVSSSLASFLVGVAASVKGVPGYQQVVACSTLHRV